MEVSKMYRNQPKENLRKDFHKKLASYSVKSAFCSAKLCTDATGLSLLLFWVVSQHTPSFRSHSTDISQHHALQMRITTWNVNGLRTTPLFKHIPTLSSDIICLQETRISGTSDPDLESLALIPNHTSYFSIPHTPGYSGVATFANHLTTPIAADEGLTSSAGGGKITTPPTVPEGSEEEGEEGDVAGSVSGIGYTKETLDMILHEGRCVITDHGVFVLLNLYIPAVSVATRLQFKRAFLCALRAKIEVLRSAGRAVILAGDFNITPSEIDTAEPIPKKDLQVWESQPSRTWLRELLSDGFVDVFRHCYPTKRGAYTCWSEALRGRVNNFGVRIDLILVDRSLIRHVKNVEVLQHVEGSDHCPVRMDIDVVVDVAEVPPPLCAAFMKRFAYRQKTLTDLFSRENGKNGTMNSSVNGENGKGNDERLIRTDVEKEGLAQKNGLKRKAIRKRLRTQAKLSTFFAPKSDSQRTESLHITQHEPLLQEPSLSEPSLSTESLEALTEESKRAAKKRREAAKAWKKILTGPPPPPLCRHGIPAVLKTVGKSGENRGRTFYSCPYPAGIGKTADCKFFKWAPYKAGLHPSFT